MKKFAMVTVCFLALNSSASFAAWPDFKGCWTEFLTGRYPATPRLLKRIYEKAVALDLAFDHLKGAAFLHFILQDAGLDERLMSNAFSSITLGDPPALFAAEIFYFIDRHSLRLGPAFDAVSAGNLYHHKFRVAGYSHEATLHPDYISLTLTALKTMREGKDPFALDAIFSQKMGSSSEIRIDILKRAGITKTFEHIWNSKVYPFSSELKDYCLAHRDQAIKLLESFLEWQDIKEDSASQQSVSNIQELGLPD